MGENLRIANDVELKRVIKALGDTALLVSDALGGFKFKEIGELMTVIDDVKIVLADKAVLLPEWEGLDEGARMDLIAYVTANVKIPASQTAEDYTQKILKAAVAFSAVLQAINS